jgi:hypothetical protein
MKDDEPSLELRLARAKLAEAEAHRKAGDEAFAKAQYTLGQSEHRLRNAEDHSRAAAEDRRWLEQHDEARVRAIVAEAEQKLAEAKQLMASYDAAKHGAAIALQQINAREKAEQAAA